MKVVGVNGSPRAAGNTFVLVNAVLDGAADGGAETALLQCGRMTLNPCTACKECKQTTHRCTIDDDMQRFYDLAPGADLLVLGSPIYLDHISANLMAFIQRLYCYLGMALENFYPNRSARVVLCTTFGVANVRHYDPVLDWMAGRFKGYWGLPTIERFRIGSTLHDSPVGASHPEVRRAFAFGRSLSSET